MLIRLSILLPLLLVGLVCAVSAEQHTLSGSGGALYPPGLVPLIARADTLLTAGQFNDAARAYSEAIEQSPADYLLYYKRATAYYSMGRHPAALADFDKVLSLTNDTFDKANLMKARIFAKEGKFAEARDALRKYSTKVKGDSASQEVMMAITEGELASKKVAQAIRAKLWQACIESASMALATASHSVKLRQQRADCSIAAGDIEGAVADLSRLAQLSTPTTSVWMKMARLGYFLFPYNSPTDPQSPAMSTLKQCLHYDPDSPQCLSMHRLVKAFDKDFKKLDKLLQAEDWRGIVKLLLGASESGTDGFAAKYDAALAEHTTREALQVHPQIPLPDSKRTSPRRAVILRSVCRAYVKMNQAKKGEQWCSELLEMHGMENDADALIGRGEALMAKEEWEEAVRLLERAFEATGRSNREIHQKLQKAQKLLKQSKQKDYYKVLGVARDADAKTIKKAYRKAVLTAHPDKGGSEAKMAAVNEAYEVLSDPELRQRYDNGDDPNDPMSQQGGNPFQQGGGYPGREWGQFFQGGFQGGGFHFPGGFQFRYSPPGHH
ncbi:hypothetical protein PYCCODRAFT_1368404 [Trametes coccinea BRFM310]|uniref:J domain-containing protein n=1 Tax=Trametes coccinea (strain BRFM310) TaxID=1353009 RepID=A0A1Y2IPI4_TRAC3|nr:hypothetical protein PYCCODRAFT_1368404 [Trametes coccinea BRFM310]